MSRPVFEKTGRPAPEFPADFLCSTPSTSLYGGISNGNITMKSVAKKDDAVSPVIGTILLVAITVVLVAIVAAVVMGMVGGVGDSKNVGVTAQPFANSSVNGFVVTVTGGNDANMIINITPYMNGVTFNSPTTNGIIEKPKVGQPVTVLVKDGKASSGQLTLTASFTDGTQAVILQNNVNIPATSSTT